MRHQKDEILRFQFALSLWVHEVVSTLGPFTSWWCRKSGFVAMMRGVRIISPYLTIDEAIPALGSSYKSAVAVSYEGLN